MSTQDSTPIAVAELLLWAQSELQASASPRLDAEVLLAHCLGKPRVYLLTWPEREVPAAQREDFTAKVALRQQGHPVAHIIGEREFWSLPIQTNNSTLIPRPDTETLVAAVLALPLPATARVLDLGTGTGAIALALKSERPQWQITAVDKSEAAVTLAATNSKALELPIKTLPSDWFSNLVETDKFDVIVSNPPYIAPDDVHLQQGDVRFEPHSALVAAQQGYADIEHILTRSCDYLTAAGWVVIEHGWQQAAGVRDLFMKKGYKNVSSLADYANVDRVTQGQFLS